MSIVFPVTSLIALPAQAWAQSTPSPAFAAPKPIPAPVVHDDAAWHTIDYHAQEHTAAAITRPANNARPPVRAERLTLLDEVGRLASPVAPDKAAGWKRLLHQPKKLAAADAAKLHVLVGEVTLAQDENPEQALWHFAQAYKLSKTKDAAHGLAVYDSAIAHFYQGAYAQSRAGFRQALTAKPGLHGFDRRTCTLFMRHAGACLGYHEERAKFGIPEPSRLDPLCGAAAVAQALKTYGKAYDKKRVLANMRVTGRGSSMQDVLNGAQKLGLAAHVVHVKDAGLIVLPKPLVAYVEHDHFVSVVEANAKGVSYLCADCGPWPGGRVSLTWAQWHRIEATQYAVLSKPGSDIDGALSALAAPDGSHAQGVQTASVGGKLAGGVTGRIKWIRLLKQTGGVTQPTGGETAYCGYGPIGQHCPDPVQCPTDDGPASCSLGAASYGDPVNLATGEEEYHPGVDLSVYNPVGPSVTWSRMYNSLRGHDSGNDFHDYGAGWSSPYQIGVYDPSPGAPGVTKYVVEPNGARFTLRPFFDPNTHQPLAPSAANPRLFYTMDNGTPFLVEWDYNAVTNGTYYTLTYADRTRYVTTDAANIAPIGSWAGLGQIVDRSGNAIKFNYLPGGYYGGQATAPILPYLTSIVDKNNVALLTINRANNGTNNITSVTDRYGRSVYYRVSTYANTNVAQGYAQSQQELDHVSQIVATGTASPPDRYVYGYQNINNGENETVPFLHTITVPSPTGTGTQTATINYLPSYCTISSLVDANGNTRSYSQPDASHTQVTVRDPQGSIVYRYTAGYDMNMSQTTRTNGAVNANGGNTTLTGFSAYADPNDPYRPSQTQDGNGYAVNGAGGKGTWEYTWDQWGNCTSMTTPRGTTTTNTFSYQNFALGELMQTQTGAKQATTYAYYEPSGLLQSTASPMPGTSGGNQSVSTSYTYDGLGNILTETEPGNNASGVIVTTYNYTTDGSYNQPAAIGQPLMVTNNLGKVYHQRYDAQANETVATDALGVETDTTFNIANQPASVVLAATGQTGTGLMFQDTDFDESGNSVRQYTIAYGREGEMLSRSGNTEPVACVYDGLYRPTALIDGNNRAIHISYNQAGYTAQAMYPNAAAGFDTTQYTSYDAKGNLLTRVDGRGTTINYAYQDPESALTDVSYPVTPAQNIHLTHDVYGRRLSMSDATGNTSYTYDDCTNLTATQTVIGPLPAQTLSYTYWPCGDRASLTTPAGTFTCAYDGVGRPTSLTNPFNEATSWSYLDNGWMAGQQLGNGVSSIYTYNARSYATDQSSRKTNNTLLSEYGNTKYDTSGSLTAFTASIPAYQAFSGITTYQFDAKDELLQEQSSRIPLGSQSGYTNLFGYDGAGNSTTFRGTSNIAYNADNQNTANTYDGNGNPTTYRGVACTYNAESQLTACGSLTMGYNGVGLRAWKQTGGTPTYFLYDGHVPVCELNAAGNVTAVNTFGDNGLVSRHTNSGSVFYTFDPQGNVSQRLDAGQNIITSCMFDSYGSRASTDTNTDPFAGFGGQSGYYTDYETGLELLGFRYYDPSAGRFLNRDPSGVSGGVNLYAYVRNNPIVFRDPSGLGPPVMEPPVALPEPIPVSPTLPVGGGGGSVGSGSGGGLGGILKSCGTICAGLTMFFCSQSPAGGSSDHRPDYYYPPAPPGRDYRNCTQARDACIKMWAGSTVVFPEGGVTNNIQQQCNNCYERCKRGRMGVRAWRGGDCDFWNWRYRLPSR